MLFVDKVLVDEQGKAIEGFQNGSVFARITYCECGQNHITVVHPENPESVNGFATLILRYLQERQEELGLEQTSVLLDQVFELLLEERGQDDFDLRFGALPEAMQEFVMSGLGIGGSIVVGIVHLGSSNSDEASPPPDGGSVSVINLSDILTESDLFEILSAILGNNNQD